MRHVLFAAALTVMFASWPAGVAVAQTTPVADDLQLQRDAIGRQTEIAAGLYVGGGLFIIGGVIGIPVGIIGVFSGESGYFELFVGGAVALGLGVIALVFAIGLHSNAEHRRRRLPAGPSVSVAPGPGDVGLAVRCAF